MRDNHFCARKALDRRAGLVLVPLRCGFLVQGKDSGFFVLGFLASAAFGGCRSTEGAVAAPGVSALLHWKAHSQHT